MSLRRIAVSASVAVLALGGLAACGGEETVRHGETEGVYVSTGGLKYQVQISRTLNPNDFEDRDFLKGLSAADRNLPGDENWFAVFLRVFNKGDQPHASARDLAIEDTTGARFRPVALNLAANSVAYIPLTVRPGDQIPVPGSLARDNSTQGGMVLFRIPTRSLDNRPLELHIASPEGGPEALVNLDV